MYRETPVDRMTHRVWEVPCRERSAPRRAVVDMDFDDETAPVCTERVDGVSDDLPGRELEDDSLDAADLRWWSSSYKRRRREASLIYRIFEGKDARQREDRP